MILLLMRHLYMLQLRFYLLQVRWVISLFLVEILHATVTLLLGIALQLPHILLSFQHLCLLLTFYMT